MIFKVYLDVQVKFKTVPSPVERVRERFTDSPLSIAERGLIATAVCIYFTV